MSNTSWKSAAQTNADILQGVKGRTFTNLGYITKTWPSWRKTREDARDDYLQHDARREFFVTMITILENAQLSYVFLRDQLSDDDWWANKIETVSEEKKQSAKSEHALMIKWFALHMLAVSIEETFRSIVRAGPQTFPRAKAMAKSATSIYPHVLKVTNLQEHKPLFDVISFIRHTLHNNGRHVGPEKVFVYRDIEFSFEDGRELTWLTETMCWQLFELVRAAMYQLVTAPAVAEIAACPRQ